MAIRQSKSAAELATIGRRWPALIALGLIAPLAGCAFIGGDIDVADGVMEPATGDVPAHIGPRRGRAAPQRADRRHAQRHLQGWVMPLGERYHPRLASKATGSIAVGTVTEGYLAYPAEIPLVGPNHRVLERTVDRHTRYTTDEMKSLLLCVAERVRAAHPEHTLHLGNLSRHRGGDIPWSVSHNNGRDADLAFLVRRPDGVVLSPDHLYSFDRSLQAPGAPEPMVFDVAANWTMVKAVISCPGPKIQNLFIARWLRYPLIRYARAIREPRELVYRAASLLRQPRRASSHSDHLHLRIACPSDDVAEGCVDRSRAPESAIGQASSVRRRLVRIRAALKSGDAEDRAAAAYLLGLYHDQKGVRALRSALRDDAAAVRSAAVDALVRIAPENAAFDIAEALDAEYLPEVATRQLGALQRLGAVELLAARLRDPRVLAGRGLDVPDVVIRKVALELLENSDSLAAATLVVPLLADSAPEVRERAHETLARIVNRSTADLVLQFAAEDAGEHLDDGRSWTLRWPMTVTDHVALWTRFLASVPATTTRDELALDGFRMRGLPIDELGDGDLSYLAVALAWERPYADNAARFISRVVKYAPEIGRGARSSPKRFWLPWLLRRRKINPMLMELTRQLGRDVATNVVTP